MSFFTIHPHYLTLSQHSVDCHMQLNHSRKREGIDITRIRSTFAPSCCTHFAAALQQLRTYFRYRFLQQQLWFQLVVVGVSQPCTRFRINVLWEWNCNIQPYICLIMGSSYVEFNAPDVEGSLPRSFPLLNKKHSDLVNICDPIDWSSILQTTVSFVSCPYPKPDQYCFLAYITCTQTLKYAWLFYSEPT